MSILLSAAEIVPATNPIAPVDQASAELVASLLVLAFSLAALGLAWALGVFKPAKIVGPVRTVAGKPLWPLIVALGVAVLIWIGAQSAYVMVRVVQHQRQQTTVVESGVPTVGVFTTADLTATDYAILATIPGLIALAAIVFSVRLIGTEWFGALGWTGRKLPAGIALGLIAALITLPVTYGFTVLLDWFYTLIDYQHPEQHELLGALKSAGSPFVKYAMIAGAAIVAPLWEEVAFRGHLQTLIGAGLAKLFPARPIVDATPGWAGATAAPATEDVVPSDTVAAGAPVLAYSAPLRDGAVVAPNVWQRWVAILVTSMLFAGVHEMWTWPAIFVLSVCLGYAYERTGNLWVPIFVHLAFNSVSTAIFLSQTV